MQFGPLLVRPERGIEKTLGGLALVFVEPLEELAAAEAKKKMTIQAAVCVKADSSPATAIIDDTLAYPSC